MKKIIFLIPLLFMILGCDLTGNFNFFRPSNINLLLKDNAKDNIKLADEALANGDYALAIAAYEKALKDLKPGTPEYEQAVNGLANAKIADKKVGLLDLVDPSSLQNVLNGGDPKTFADLIPSGSKLSDMNDVYSSLTPLLDKATGKSETLDENGIIKNVTFSQDADSQTLANSGFAHLMNTVPNVTDFDGDGKISTDEQKVIDNLKQGILKDPADTSSIANNLKNDITTALKNKTGKDPDPKDVQNYAKSVLTESVNDVIVAKASFNESLKKIDAKGDKATPQDTSLKTMLEPMSKIDSIENEFGDILNKI